MVDSHKTVNHGPSNPRPPWWRQHSSDRLFRVQSKKNFYNTTVGSRQLVRAFSVSGGTLDLLDYSIWFPAGGFFASKVISIGLVLQDCLLMKQLYQDSCLLSTTLGGGRRLYWCVVLVSLRYNVTAFCMEAFSVSALSVPTKLSIRHRDCISLKGWVSVLWYFVDD